MGCVRNLSRHAHGGCQLDVSRVPREQFCRASRLLDWRLLILVTLWNTNINPSPLNLKPYNYFSPQGVFLAKGLVILKAGGEAFLSLGFRKYCALAMPLQQCRNEHGVDLFFRFPERETVRPRWLFNTTVDVQDNTLQACSVKVLPPACLPKALRAHGCILVPFRPLEPLVKAALRR